MINNHNTNGTERNRREPDSGSRLGSPKIKFLPRLTVAAVDLTICSVPLIIWFSSLYLSPSLYPFRSVLLDKDIEILSHFISLPPSLSPFRSFFPDIDIEIQELTHINSKFNHNVFSNLIYDPLSIYHWFENTIIHIFWQKWFLLFSQFKTLYTSVTLCCSSSRQFLYEPCKIVPHLDVVHVRKWLSFWGSLLLTLLSLYFSCNFLHRRVVVHCPNEWQMIKKLQTETDNSWPIKQFIFNNSKLIDDIFGRQQQQQQQQIAVVHLSWRYANGRNLKVSVNERSITPTNLNTQYNKLPSHLFFLYVHRSAPCDNDLVPNLTHSFPVPFRSVSQWWQRTWSLTMIYLCPFPIPLWFTSRFTSA